MTSMALGRDAWKPEQPGGFGVGAVFALFAHAALVVALAIGVNWHSSSVSTVVSAELWAAVPEVAAPQPVAPPPEPPKPQPRPEPPKPDPRIEQQRIDAQIALEKAEREKKRQHELEEKLKAEKEKQEKLKEEKKRAELTAKMREQQLARLRDLAGATGPGPQTSTGTAQRDAAPSKDYGGRIKARVKPNIVLTAEISGNPIAEVEVRCAPDGRIIGRRIVTPSGNALWDEAVLRAIDRTEVLPRDTETGRVPSPMLLKFSLRE